LSLLTCVWTRRRPDAPFWGKGGGVKQILIPIVIIAIVDNSPVKKYLSAVPYTTYHFIKKPLMLTVTFLGGPGVHHSVGKLLQPLAARITQSGGRISDLYLVHRLDKETTGVMVLAK